MQDKRVFESSQKSTIITNNHFQDTGNQHGTIDCNQIELGEVAFWFKKNPPKNMLNGTRNYSPININLMNSYQNTIHRE